MTSDQLSQARDLIRQKKYEEARVLLQHSDDPQAAVWLNRLNQMVPPPPSASFRQAANAAPEPVKQEPVAPKPASEPTSAAAPPADSAPAAAPPATKAAEPAAPEPPAIQAKKPAAPPVEPEEVPAATTQVTKHKMLEARQLLLDSRFEEARKLLETITHPMAQKWLDTLNKKVPPKPAEVSDESPTDLTPPEAIRVRATSATNSEPPAAIPVPTLDALTTPLGGEPAQAKTADKTASPPTGTPAAKPAPSATGAKPAPSAAAPAAPPAEVERVTATMSDSDVLRLAQEALLNDQYDKAREMLEPLQSAEAAFWLEKTGMTKFRSYENIWLDLFNYEVSLDPGVDPDTWRCSLCSRTTGQALTCPQRGQLPCPVEFSERDIKEPRRLALLLQGLYLGQSQEMGKILGHINPDLLRNWKTELEWQLTHMGQIDVRRPVVTAAIPLLAQYAEARQAILDSQPIPTEVAQAAKDAQDAPGSSDEQNMVGRVLKFIRKQVIN